jgi:glycerol kinase
MNTGNKRITSKNNLLTTLACDINGNLQYALEGSVFIAGAALKWLRDELKLISKVEETENMAISVSDTNGVYFVPAFVGLGAPYWDMYARGIITGLTLGAGKEHLVRATLESIAFQTKDVIEAMHMDSGICLRELRVDGGASTNAFLMQFQADILETKVTRASNYEITASGSAYLAGLYSEFWSHDDIYNIWEEGNTYLPNMEESKRIEKYEGWKQAVKKCR